MSISSEYADRVPPPVPSIETFHTERLTAERLRTDHLPDYLRLLQDARVTATLTPDGKPLPETEVRRWLRFSVEHWERHGFGYWALRNRAGEQFVGRAGLKHVEIGGRQEVELAYALVPGFWGLGLATEIAMASLERAFGPLGLEHVICLTLTTNGASRRVMEKVGFQFEAEIIHAGLPHVLFRLTASEFRRPRSH